MALPPPIVSPYQKDPENYLGPTFSYFAARSMATSTAAFSCWIKATRAAISLIPMVIFREMAISSSLGSKKVL